MKKSPTICADDLHTILEKFKNDPKSRSANHFLQRLELGPKQHIFVYQPHFHPGTLLRPLAVIFILGASG